MVNFNFGLGGTQGDDQSVADPATTTAADPVVDPTAGTQTNDPTPNVVIPEKPVTEPGAEKAVVTEPVAETIIPEKAASEEENTPFAPLPPQEAISNDKTPTTDTPAVDPFSTEPAKEPVEPTENDQPTEEETKLGEPDQDIFSNENPFAGIAQTPAESANEAPATKPEGPVAPAVNTEPAAAPLFENITEPPATTVEVEAEAVKQPEPAEEEPAPIATAAVEMDSAPVADEEQPPEPKIETPTETPDFAAATTAGAAIDPLSTLTNIKNEISDFVKARKSAIADLEKEIDDLEKNHKKAVQERREKINSERNALRDKQQAYKKMAEDLMHLTDAFGGQHNNKNNGHKHEKNTPKKTFHSPQSRIVRPAKKD